MGYWIGAILVIIVIIIIGLILRKRIYDGVDRLESWKLDIMGRNIAAQISQIKALNLSGETQERFETWKERWERIVTKELPDIEEYLFDAEETADRFRISTAKKILSKIEKTLEKIEADIKKMLEELDDLLDSAETSKLEVEDLEPAVNEIRKEFSRNRIRYGKAESYFEQLIDELSDSFIAYNELADSGNYIEARALVQEIKHDKVALETKLEAFPIIYKKCRHEIPSQLDNVLSGIKEMRADGYRVEHLGLENEIRTYHERLADLLQLLHKGETNDAVTMIEDIEERVKEMYELLEKEAIARNYLEAQLPNIGQTLEELTTNYDVTKEEVEILKKAYYLEDHDMEKFLSIGKRISALNEQLEVIKVEVDNELVGHSKLRERVENSYLQLEELEAIHETFKDNISNLRKDELEARERLADMRHQLHGINRKLKKSNIPGIPTFIWNSMENTMNKNNQVIKSLEKQPLDMGVVQQTLEEAGISLEQTIEQTDLMLDQAYLTEQVIQYANRYRSRNPILAAKLMESERLFMAYEYELALETAAKAIEEVEPGALKRIEENQALIMN